MAGFIFCKHCEFWYPEKDDCDGVCCKADSGNYMRYVLPDDGCTEGVRRID